MSENALIGIITGALALAGSMLGGLTFTLKLLRKERVDSKNERTENKAEREQLLIQARCEREESHTNFIQHLNKVDLRHESMAQRHEQMLRDTNEKFTEALNRLTERLEKLHDQVQELRVTFHR